MIRRVYRAGSASECDLKSIAEGSRNDPGRFNTAECGALYVSFDEETALFELRRTTEEDGDSLVDAHPCSILRIDATVMRLWDLTRPEVVRRHHLSRADIVSDDKTACQRVAGAAIDEGVEAIIWESAARDGGLSMAIFLERLEPASSVTLVERADVARERLAEIAARR